MRVLGPLVAFADDLVLCRAGKLGVLTNGIFEANSL